MSIRLKLMIVIGAFLFLIVVAVGVTVYTINSLKKDSSTVNLAGRQRMLAQKFGKELFAEVVPAQVKNSAVRAARMVTIQIKEDRAKYTKGVIGKLKKELPGFKPARNWSALKGGVPLPATFVQEVSEKINKSGVYRYDLLSRWNLNKEKGLSSDFENAAFDSLLADKGAPYYRFMDYGGKSVLRYATPDIAGASACVSCHNAHPASAKRDFKLGDVMGVLIVTIPVSAEITKGSGVWGESTGSGDDNGSLKAYQKTAKVFETTLSALIKGGQAPLNLTMSKFTTVVPSPNPAVIAQLKVVNGLWHEMMKDVAVLVNAPVNSPEYVSALGAFLKLNSEIVAQMNRAVGMYEADSLKGISNMMKVLGVFVVLAFCVAFGAIILITRSIIRPINAVVEFAGTMAAKDLSSADLNMKSSDEIGALAQALDTMKRNLNEIIGQIRKSSDHVAASTSLLSTTSTQIVNGIDRQSNQTNQVATAMEEMSATVIEVAKNSQGASEASDDTQQIAVQGGDVVKRAVDGMMTVADTVRQSATTVEALGKSSDEIGAIISVINDIADQTNLLALNAAIEAARAGEQGRGFAVVADEVRKLAEKTTKATKEIADMIKTIQGDTKGAMGSMHEGTKQVEEGVQLASEAGESLQQIVSSVDRVTDMVRQIATAAEEQSATSEEITSNITGIAGIAEENSDGVKEVSSAADELNRIAEDLKMLVGTFILAAGAEQGADATGNGSEHGAGEGDQSRQGAEAGGNVVSFDGNAGSDLSGEGTAGGTEGWGS
ncbi:Methyl-accepting chemotaxis protein I (serine chemoreceptor protein) [hydrothermal vent metagenome]|uniref:Methyl-accepting chemotaxis protein I (Serine chemoreceptor protein) n=1 Tax=hydrothermal vent metagenome TaxID=652676 RepID=A0A3B0V9S2_9ZZZZ